MACIVGLNLYIFMWYKTEKEASVPNIIETDIYLQECPYKKKLDGKI